MFPGSSDKCSKEKTNQARKLEVIGMVQLEGIFEMIFEQISDNKTDK